jgi:CRP/FNR family transcriptional regulator
LRNPLSGLQHQSALHPFTLNEHELDQLDNIIERKKPIQKQTLFKAGDELKSLYAIRSGTIKSYTITEQGDEQIPASTWRVIWLALTPSAPRCPSFAQALETSMVCEIPSKPWTIFPVKCRICVSR